MTIAAQLAMLQNCVHVIGRLLRREGESTLLASKILVLGRMTWRILSQLEPHSELIKSLENKLSSFRKKLLQAIDARLADHKADVTKLVEHLSAHSLANRATTKDILQHFHKVRLKAIEKCLAGEKPTNEDATKAVHLLVGTLNILQQIFPKKITEALSKLKQKQLIQHQDVRAVSELDLELHEKWIAEELRNYTVWQGQEVLQKADTDKALKAWAKDAVKAFISGLRSNLQRMTSFQEIIILRRDVFQTWPWSGKKLPGLDYTEVADELREIINERLGELLTACAGRLKDVLGSISSNIQSSDDAEESNPDLWNTEYAPKDLLNGATGYKDKIKSSFRGEDTRSKAAIDSYSSWAATVSELATVVNGMRNDRWDDDLEEDDDYMDGDSRQILLSSDDPRDLERLFVKALEASFTSLQKGLEDLIDKTVKSDDSDILTKRIAYLRILRELLRQGIGEGFRTKVDLKATIDQRKLLLLQEKIATHAVESSISSFKVSLKKVVSFKSMPGKLLWQGSPPLPVQPSPATYRLLQNLSTEMSNLGPDIWAAGTVSVLKRQTAKLIDPVVTSSGLLDAPSTAVNGSKEDEPTEESSEESTEKETEAKEAWNDKLTQLYFDVAYIASALAADNAPAGQLENTLKSIQQKASLAATDATRLEKSAFEYWKRTYLMFALLAG
jgi:hypothetical protein